MTSPRHPVFTIGHSSHALDAFVALLRPHKVSAVADVRSAPYSRMNPQFNREAFAGALAAKDISYFFLGRELGGRPDDPTCYVNGRVRYGRLARTELFLSGIERVIREAEDCRLALMCAEKEPLDCHRTLLVVRTLAERGLAIRHILADGRLESHDAAMERLLDVTGLPHDDLFRTKAELIAEALARQEERVAFVDKRRADGAWSRGGEA